MKVPPRVSKTLARLPRRPGVYIHKDAAGNILYVGKAKTLRNRVRSYFHPNATLDPAKRIMVSKIADIEYIVVDSEIEALLLESTLIKKHRPPYNVIFKDDKYYQYIKINLKEDYPGVETVRRITKDGGRYFGPFTSGYSVRQTLQLLKRIFPYRSCGNPPDKPCFDVRLGRCLGHNLSPGSHERYADIIHAVIRFLEGDVASTLKALKRQMADAASQRHYELAATFRDRIRAVEKITAEQKVVSTRLESEDVIGLHRIGDITCVNLFQIRTGKLVNRQFHILQHTDEQLDADVLASFISQYYAETGDHPKVVLTSTAPTDAAGLSRTLQLKFASPSRGRKRKLIRLAELNARGELERRQRDWLSKEARAKLGLKGLAEYLLLPDPPKRVECYDISNVQGTNAVGSMVVFEDGLPKKSAYKKFKIKTVDGPNDFAMLREVMRRRFGHDHASEGWPNPDLMIIDGGKGQLNSVLTVFRELNVLIPTVGLAKREEEIFRPGQKESLRLPKDSEALFLVQRIRDEAHRFAIGYYRKRHGIETTKSLLDEIPGIGPTLKKKLLSTFGSVEGVRRAEDGQLEKILGQHKTKLLRKHL